MLNKIYKYFSDSSRLKLLVLVHVCLDHLLVFVIIDIYDASGYFDNIYCFYQTQMLSRSVVVCVGGPIR